MNLWIKVKKTRSSDQICMSHLHYYIYVKDIKACLEYDMYVWNIWHLKLDYDIYVYNINARLEYDKLSNIKCNMYVARIWYDIYVKNINVCLGYDKYV